MTRALLTLVGAVALCMPTIALAQQQQQQQQQRPGVRRGVQQPARRLQLEQQLRRGFWRIAKTRIGLSDDQMGRLESATGRFDARRRTLLQDERVTRAALRREMLADSAANGDRITTALDRLLDIQRQRLDVMAEEQREIASFMTPLQRAKYVALHEQVRRRVDELRRARPEESEDVGPPRGRP